MFDLFKNAEQEIVYIKDKLNKIENLLLLNLAANIKQIQLQNKESKIQVVKEIQEITDLIKIK